MRTETKFASMRGVIQRLSLQDVFQSARRLFDPKSERASLRSLRDIDDWSDQSEVAFYEETAVRRA